MSVTWLGWTLVHFVWQGVLAAGLLAAANLTLRRASPRARYAAALVTLIGMLGLPAATLATMMRRGAGPHPIPPRAMATLGPAISPSEGLAAPGTPIAAAAATAEAPSWMAVLVGTWAVGVLLLALRALGGYWLVRRWRRSARPLDAAWPEERLRALCARMRLWLPVRLCESVLVEVPTVIGWLRPLVLLPPATLLGLTPVQLEAVLAHELAHVRRLDALVGLLQTLAETVLFYHPAVWWVSHRLRLEREQCCDDAAVALSGDALGYARTLAELEALRRVATAAPRLALDGGSLSARVRRLLGASGTPSARLARWPVGLLVMALMVVAALTPVATRDVLGRPAVVEQRLGLAEPGPVATDHGPGVEAAVLAPAAGEGLTGTWSITPVDGKTREGKGPLVQLAFQFRSRRGGSWNSSNTVPLAELRGLTWDQTQAPSAEVGFEIVRDAGTLRAEGRFRNGSGAGHFTFTPDEGFLGELRSRGYGAVDRDQAFSLALHDVSRAFIAELARLGYQRVSVDGLVSFRIHGVTPAFIGELAALGYKPAADQLVSFRIHGVSAELVRDLEALGYDDMPADQLVSLRIHGVTAEFARGLTELGYPRPSLEALVSMRIHGVSLEMVRELKAMGYEQIGVDELVSMRIHGASPEFVRALRELGYERVPVADLVSMRIHGVSPEFVRRANRRAGSRLPVERLVSMRIHGATE